MITKDEVAKEVMSVTVKEMPLWIVRRLRVSAAQRGEKSYTRELVRVLEQALNKEER